MAARGMVDESRPASRRPPLQPGQLDDKRGWSSSSMRRALSKGKKSLIEVALRSGALLEFDPVLSESSTRPFAGVPIAVDVRHAITAAAG